VSKDKYSKIIHGFGLTQNLDRVVLEGIKLVLHISTEVKFNSKYNYYILDTTNSRSIENIINYFYNTMKGMKSLEYRIWARSYNKHKGNFKKLSHIKIILIRLTKLLDL
jgi:hypothetical protein